MTIVVAGRIHPAIRALSLFWLLPKRALLRRRLSKRVLERVCGHRIAVLPGVFNPVVFRSGRFFAEYLQREYLPAAGTRELSVLDLGTGSGVLAIICASFGHRVTATDVNPKAVDCARGNVETSGYGRSIEVGHGDLFDPVAGRRFDLILWNPPFFSGEPDGRFDMSWRSNDAVDRFAAELREHLSDAGSALLIWSSQAGDAVLVERLAAHGFSPRPLRSGHFGVELFTIYEARPES